MSEKEKNQGGTLSQLKSRPQLDRDTVENAESLDEMKEHLKKELTSFFTGV